MLWLAVVCMLNIQNQEDQYLYTFQRKKMVENIWVWCHGNHHRLLVVGKTQSVSVQKKSSKKEGKRSSTRQKQSIQRHSINRSHFINKPLSNYDLKNWTEQLGINYFRGVFSKDVLPKQIKNIECGIVNLDDHIGPGTRWVVYRNIDRFCEYFDSFGLMMPTEVSKYMATSGKQLVYSGDEIQERDSVLCGYYLLERQKGRSILDNFSNFLVILVI